MLLEQQIKFEKKGEGRNQHRIVYYQDLKRLKITKPSGDIIYTAPTVEKSYNKTLNYDFHEEFKEQLLSETIKSNYHLHDEDNRIVKFGKKLLQTISLNAYNSDKDIYLENSNSKVERQYCKMKRDIYTDPDGNVSYGEWEAINIYYK